MMVGSSVPSNFFAVAIAALTVLSGSVHAKTWVLSSPDQSAEVALFVADGQPRWALEYNGRKLLEPSPLGLVLDKAYEGGFAVLGVTHIVESERMGEVRVQQRNHMAPRRVRPASGIHAMTNRISGG